MAGRAPAADPFRAHLAGDPDQGRRNRKSAERGRHPAGHPPGGPDPRRDPLPQAPRVEPAGVCADLGRGLKPSRQRSRDAPRITKDGEMPLFMASVDRERSDRGPAAGSVAPVHSSRRSVSEGWTARRAGTRRTKIQTGDPITFAVHRSRVGLPRLERVDQLVLIDDVLRHFLGAHCAPHRSDGLHRHRSITGLFQPPQLRARRARLRESAGRLRLMALQPATIAITKAFDQHSNRTTIAALARLADGLVTPPCLD